MSDTESVRDRLLGVTWAGDHDRNVQWAGDHDRNVQYTCLQSKRLGKASCIQRLVLGNLETQRLAWHMPQYAAPGATTNQILAPRKSPGKPKRVPRSAPAAFSVPRQRPRLSLE